MTVEMEPGGRPDWIREVQEKASRTGEEGPLVEATQPEPALGLPVVEFEGEFVRKMEGVLPQITMDMDAGYARGTHLKMMVEVRVRNVRFDEVKGEVVRRHHFALEEIQLLGAYTADQVDPGVGGSASVAAPEEESDPDVGF